MCQPVAHDGSQLRLSEASSRDMLQVLRTIVGTLSPSRFAPKGMPLGDGTPAMAAGGAEDFVGRKSLWFRCEGRVNPRGVFSGQRLRSSDKQPCVVLLMPGSTLAASVISPTALRYQSKRPRIDQMPQIWSRLRATLNRRAREGNSQTADI